ncbi:MAG: hypothetical protein ACUVXI_03055 [bacterium]
MRSPVDELFAGRLFALDVIVRTPEQIEDSLRSGNSFLKQEIIAKGQVLNNGSKPHYSDKSHNSCFMQRVILSGRGAIRKDNLEE